MSNITGQTFIDRISPYQIAGIKVKDINTGSLTINSSRTGFPRTYILSKSGGVDFFNINQNLLFNLTNCIFSSDSVYNISMDLDYTLINNISESKTFFYGDYFREKFLESQNNNPLFLNFSGTTLQTRVEGSNCLLAKINNNPSFYIPLNSSVTYTNISPNIYFSTASFNNISGITISGTSLTEIITTGTTNTNLANFANIDPNTTASTRTFNLRVNNTPFADNLVNITNFLVQLNNFSTVTSTAITRNIVTLGIIDNYTPTQRTNYVNAVNNLTLGNKRWFIDTIILEGFINVS